MNEDYKTKDYSYLEGKIIKYIYDNNGEKEEFEAIISGCDYDIGISIEVVSNKEKKHVKDFFGDYDPHLMCLPGLSTKEFEHNDICQNNKYDECFQRLIHRIESGVIKSSVVNDLYSDEVGFHISECTFT